MKSINNTWAKLKREAYFQAVSGVLLAMLLVPLVVIGLGFFGSALNLQASHELYLQTKQSYQAAGEDIQQALATETSVDETEQGGQLITVIDNPLRHDHDQVSHLLAVLKPGYVVQQTLEKLFVLSPLLFGVYGAWLASYDWRHKTVRLRSLMTHWWELCGHRHLFLALLVLVLVSALPLLFGGLSHLLYPLLTARINQAEFAAIALGQDAAWIQQISLTWLAGVLTGWMGYLLGTVFKQLLLPVLLLTGYYFLIPLLPPFDPRNLLSALGHEVFVFAGDTRLTPAQSITFAWALLSVLVLCLLCLTASYLLSKRQERYA